MITYNGVEFTYDDGFSNWPSELAAIKKAYGTNRYVPSNHSFARMALRSLNRSEIDEAIQKNQSLIVQGHARNTYPPDCNNRHPLRVILGTTDRLVWIVVPVAMKSSNFFLELSVYEAGSIFNRYKRLYATP